MLVTQLTGITMEDSTMLMELLTQLQVKVSKTLNHFHQVQPHKLEL